MANQRSAATEQALMDAVDRIVSPQKTPTVEDVARAAGVSRATANRYADVLAYFRTKLAALPEAQLVTLRKEMARLKSEHNAERAKLKEAAEVLAQRVQVLTLALEQKEGEKRATVIDMATRRG